MNSNLLHFTRRSIVIVIVIFYRNLQETDIRILLHGAILENSFYGEVLQAAKVNGSHTTWLHFKKAIKPINSTILRRYYPNVQHLCNKKVYNYNKANWKDLNYDLKKVD